MTPELLAELIRKHVVEVNVATYKAILSWNASSATDEYWKKVLALYAELNEQQRQVLVAAMRQAAIDSCASLLGIIENADSLGVDRAFELRYQGEVIETSTQDCFLALFE
jgi:hypothetical protein